MLFLKLIQSLVQTLHSEGTPGQVAAGIALGSVLGLTPLVNLHNALAFALIVILNVSFGGAMLGWALFVPMGFLLDPAFDWIGHKLLLRLQRCGRCGPRSTTRRWCRLRASTTRSCSAAWRSRPLSGCRCSTRADGAS